SFLHATYSGVCRLRSCSASWRGFFPRFRRCVCGWARGCGGEEERGWVSGGRLNCLAILPGMMNWVFLIASGSWFALCTIPQRKGSASAAAFGIAGVVAVFVSVLSIAQGFRRAVTATGRDDIAIVLREGANNEMSSGLGREEVRVIKDAPGVAR